MAEKKNTFLIDETDLIDLTKTEIEEILTEIDNKVQSEISTVSEEESE